MIFPFLFITIACGAISGFHCLVSSGTSSKQLKTNRMRDSSAMGGCSMRVFWPRWSSSPRRRLRLGFDERRLPDYR